MTLSFYRRKPEVFDFEEVRQCKNCERQFKGRFCNFCGEKVVERNERTFIYFIGGFLNAITFLEGKFIRSLKFLVFKPGQLSRDIADGKRVPYMRLISLFFLANFFYFLFPVFDSYNSSLYTQLNFLGSHSSIATALVNSRLEADSLSFDEFQQRYSAQSTSLSKLLIILLVFAFTFFLQVIYYSRRLLFFDHFLFSLEFYSFQLLVNSVVLANFLNVLIWLGEVLNVDWSFLISSNIFTIVTIILLGYFLGAGQRIFYKTKWFWNIPKTVILLAWLQLSVHLYRILLFYITLWTV